MTSKSINYDKFHPPENMNKNMDHIEQEAVDLIKNRASSKIDPLPIVRELWDREVIDDLTYNQLLRNNEDITALCQDVFDLLKHNCSFLTLIEILLKTEQAGLVDLLLYLVKTGNNRRGICRVYRTETDKYKPIRRFFKNLKSQVHDATLSNPREALRSLAERFHSKFRRETDASKKQHIADKLVAILGVEIDAHAITFNCKLSHHDLFDELKTLVRHSSNTMMTDVSYYGRLANANAIGGRFADGRHLLVKAQCSAANFTACLEVANMYYIEVYVRLWEFEKTRSQELKLSLLEMARKGIYSLQEEDEEIRLLWTRMFILRMVFCLLGIGNRANILTDYSPEKEDITQASDLLQKLEPKRMETRRKMFYWVAKARLSELNGNFKEALSSASIARNLALSGNFKETVFIERYLSDLNDILSYVEEILSPLGIQTEMVANLNANYRCLANYAYNDVSNQQEPEATCSKENNSKSLCQLVNSGYCGKYSTEHIWSPEVVWDNQHMTTEQKRECSGHGYRDDDSCPGMVQLSHQSIIFISPVDALGWSTDPPSYCLPCSSSHQDIIDAEETEDFGYLYGGQFEYQIASDDSQVRRDRKIEYLQNYDMAFRNSKEEACSPYLSDSRQQTPLFTCSYIREKADDGCPEVYLFHNTAVLNCKCAMDNGLTLMESIDDNTHVKCAGEAQMISFNDEEQGAQLSSECNFSSIDSDMLFGPTDEDTPDPQELNSIVLFEDRGEPEGNSIT